MTTKENNVHKGHRQRIKNLVSTKGFTDMHDYQILEFVLFFAIPYKDTNEIAHLLIEKFGSLDKVMDADINDLITIKDMTENACILINSLPKLLVEYEKSKNIPKTILNINNILPYLRSILRLKPYECLYLISLDGKNAIISTDQITTGNNTLSVATKDIIKLALFHKAHAVILCHNHPSGNAMPSYSDIECTSILHQTLTSLDIKLIDHIIISDKETYSFYLKDKLREQENNVNRFDVKLDKTFLS
ncbi:MAG: JAB domain-containing protein [Clostridia bacterium]